MQSKQKLIQQGAEAKIFKLGNKVVKDRTKKSYRLPKLDATIRRRRTKSETKLLEKVSKILNAPIPKPYKDKSTEIEMPFIEGKKLSQSLDSLPLNQQKEILKQIGKDIAKLHDNDIIHGDLTTSNMILVDEKVVAHKNSQDNENPKGNKNSEIDDSEIVSLKRSGMTRSGAKPSISEPMASVFFIDFGLGFVSKKIEDKAVDIHLLKQALEAKHFKHWETLYKEFLKGYTQSPNFKKVLSQLGKVEKRGRYRH